VEQHAHVRGKKLADTPTSFCAGEYPLIQPSRASLIPEPLWLIVMSNNHMKLSLLNTCQAYLQLYDLESFFRFGKQKLLLDKFQIPDDEHEER